MPRRSGRPSSEPLRDRRSEWSTLSVLSGQRTWFGRPDRIGSYRLRAVSAVGLRLPLMEPRTAALAASTTPTPRSRSAVWIPWWPKVYGEIEIRRTGIAFDRNEHTPGISAAATHDAALGDNADRDLGAGAHRTDF